MSVARMLPLKMPASQRALGWAVLAAAVFHGVIWLLLQQGGLTGRRDGGGGTSAGWHVGSISMKTEGLPGAEGIRIRVMDGAAWNGRPSVAVDDSGESLPAGVDAPLSEASLARAPAQASVAAGAEHLLPTVYWASESLQSSPRPQLGWVLDEEVLDGVRQARIFLQIWVSALGQIDQVQVLKAEPPGEWVHRALAHVAETAMLPGVKDGQAVPATVVVEIVSDVERFR